VFAFLTIYFISSISIDIILSLKKRMGSKK
jgi:hypothetical protein